MYTLTLTSTYVLINESDSVQKYIPVKNIESIEQRNDVIFLITNAEKKSDYKIEYSKLEQYNGGGVPAQSTILTALLNLVYSPNEILTFAKNGEKVVTGTDEVSGSWGGFVVNADSTSITSMKVDGVAATLEDYGLNSYSMPKGFIFFFADSKTLTAIKPAAGSFTMINR